MLSRYMHLANFLQDNSNAEIMVGIGYFYNFYCYVMCELTVGHGACKYWCMDISELESRNIMLIPSILSSVSIKKCDNF